MILGHTNKNVNNTFMIAKRLKIEKRVGCLEIYKKQLPVFILLILQVNYKINLDKVFKLIEEVKRL